MRAQTVAFAKALGVVGLINVQFAIKDGVVYVLEVNPRASRTVPFVSKAIGVPLAVGGGARDDWARRSTRSGSRRRSSPPYVAVKEAVFPFSKFREFDPILGPEMRSTGEVMGMSDSLRDARSPRRRSRPTTGCRRRGPIFITVNDSDKPTVVPIARRFHEMGFQLFATEGTARYLRGARHPGRAGVQGARWAAQRDRPDHESARCSSSSTRR